MNDPDTRELFDLLADGEMQAVLMAHDDIARKSFEPIQYPVEPEPYREPHSQSPQPAAHNDVEGPVKIVNVRKMPGEALVSTVEIVLM